MDKYKNLYHVGDTIMCPSPYEDHKYNVLRIDHANDDIELFDILLNKSKINTGGSTRTDMIVIKRGKFRKYVERLLSV
jgi:hypothetical protein